MHTRRKISFLFLLAAIAVCSCKKKTNEPTSASTPTFIKDAVDTIIGVYVGNLYYRYYYHSMINTSKGGFDTVTHSDTFFVLKKSDTSFCYYTSAVYGIDKRLRCQTYNKSNVFTNPNVWMYADTLIFYPEKDSMFHHYSEIYTSGHAGHHETEETFSGKKIK